MKKAVIAAAIFFLAFSALAAEHHSPLKSSPGFDKLKSLAGKWTADVPGVGKVTATYTLHSDNSALLEEFTSAGMPSMITIYYPAGNDVAMTHYCSAHNQPKMKAGGADANSLNFTLTSVENLASKDDDHMIGVRFTFADSDHFTAVWSNAIAGKTTALPFEFTRVR
jgi:hypothetical protein